MVWHALRYWNERSYTSKELMKQDCCIWDPTPSFAQDLPVLVASLAEKRSVETRE